MWIQCRTEENLEPYTLHTFVLSKIGFADRRNRSCRLPSRDPRGHNEGWLHSQIASHSGSRPSKGRRLFGRTIGFVFVEQRAERFPRCCAANARIVLLGGWFRHNWTGKRACLCAGRRRLRRVDGQCSRYAVFTKEPQHQPEGSCFLGFQVGAVTSFNWWDLSSK